MNRPGFERQTRREFSVALTVVLTALFTMLAAPSTHSQPADTDLSFLTTRAEVSDYRETTRYDAVRAFLDVLADASERMHTTTFGYSVKGRPLPLAVFGEVEDASPQAVRAADGKTRVFVMANIHAGEVAGKEAALMLLRKLAAGRHAAWADSLVVMVAPIYNADGNEEISLFHRPYQLGPIGGMGARYNAQGLDLNRDHTKLASPEAHALARLFAAYDPHVALDLHTTNGTKHAYHLTYAPPLHPSTPESITRLLREEWLPDVRRSMREEHGYEAHEYGIAGKGYYGRGGPQAERGWYTFSHRPRFSSNYVGLRGRFGILSETYAYAPFKERVLATLRFVEEVTGWAHRHAAEVRRRTAQADAEAVPGARLALRAEHASRGPDTLLMGAVDTLRHPYTGRPLYKRLPGVARAVQMPAYTRFRATERVRLPRAYLVPDTLRAVIDRLDAHGVQYQRTEAPGTRAVQQFRINAVRVAENTYEDRRARTYAGTYERTERRILGGTLVVPTDQPLGRLAGLLLEPRSDDGFAHWAFFEELGAGDMYPILRQPVTERERAGGS